MKENTSRIFLLVFCLLILTGCSQENVDYDAETPDAAESVVSELAVSVESSEAFTTAAGNLLQYELEAIPQELPEVLANAERAWYADGYLCYLRTEGTQTLAGRISTDLEPVSEILLAEDSSNTDFLYVVWAEQSVRAVCAAYSEDEDGTVIQSASLLCFSADGILQSCTELPEDEAVCGLAVTQNNDTVVLTETTLLWLDTGGNLLEQSAVRGLGSMVKAADGTLYLVIAGTVQPVDIQTRSAGETIFSFDGNYELLPGSGDWDFLLLGPERLLAVSLEEHCFTEILQWASCNVYGEIQTAVQLEQEQWLAVSQDLSITCWLIQPAEEGTAKTQVTIAVPGGDAVYGQQYQIDDFLYDQILRYNAENSDVELILRSYADALELQKMLLSGEYPDMIIFDRYSSDADKPMEQIYAASGLLVDLAVLLEADQDTSVEDILPNIAAAQEASLGGLYTLPSRFCVLTWYGRSELVGEAQGWTMEEFLTAAEALPEEVCIYQYALSPENLLTQILTYSLDSFVDFETLTAQFDSELFVRLLEVCRARGLPESGADVASGTAMLSSITKKGTVAYFAGQIAELGADMQLIGIPGAGGSGAVLTYTDTIAICSAGTHQEEAWAFFKTLLEDDYQLNSLAWYEPVTVSAWEAHNTDITLPVGVTEDVLAQAEYLILNAQVSSWYDSPITSVVLEEAVSFFSGDKSAETVADIIQDRVQTYLWEQT